MTLRLLAIAVLMMGIADRAASAAQSCSELIQEFATQENIPLDTETGSGSSGVVTPPEAGASRDIQPPPQAGANMPTHPPVMPGGGSGNDAVPGSALDQAARQARVESLVAAARQASQSGDETGCLDRLIQAQDLAHGPIGSDGADPAR